MNYTLTRALTENIVLLKQTILVTHQNRRKKKRDGSEKKITENIGGGRVVRWCWENFQCWGVLLIWMRVGQGPTALAVGAGGGLFGHFYSHLSFLSSFSLSLGDGPM